MSAELFTDAMSQISDKYISEALNYRSKVAKSKCFRHRLSVAIIAAILAVFLMGAGVVAVIYGDNIQNWFSHYWEVITGQEMDSEQTAIIDHLTQDISQSETVGEITVTVDSATIGDDSFFLLIRVEGIEFSTKYSYDFEDFEIHVTPDPISNSEGISGFGYEYHGLDGDGAVLLLAEYKFTSRKGFIVDTRPLDISISLKNLICNVWSDEKDMAEIKSVENGVWNFKFTLDRSNLPAPIILSDTEVVVMDLEKRETAFATITNIELTNTGIRFQYDCDGGKLNLHTPISAVLYDGTIIESGGGTGYLQSDETTLNCSYRWMVPIDLTEVSAVIVGDTQIIVPQGS